MLVRPDATYIDQATKSAARIFPTGTKWLEFESRLPATAVFRDAVMDPAIGRGSQRELGWRASDLIRWIGG